MQECLDHLVSDIPNGVIVEKDRYVAIGGPGVGGSCNCVAFTVLASQIKKSHMVILHEGRALGKAELEHYPRCAVCKKGPGWHLMNDHKSHISPAIIRDSDRRNSLVRKQSMLEDLLQAHVEELRSPSTYPQQALIVSMLLPCTASRHCVLC